MKFTKKIGLAIFAVLLVEVCSGFAQQTLTEYLEKIGEYKELSDYKTRYIEGKYVSFGAFPQTIKSADVEIDESSSTVRFGQTYYKGSDNAWYVKIYASPFRNNITFSDGSNVEKGMKYYFKVEPIKWRVLENGLLLAENILVMNIQYYQYYEINRKIDGKTVYPNNYKESRVRAYLNGLSYTEKAEQQLENSNFVDKGFLQIAFTEKQREKIGITKVDNSQNIGRFSSKNTEDNVFILAEKEAGKKEYGFIPYDVIVDLRTSEVEMNSLLDLMALNLQNENDDLEQKISKKRKELISDLQKLEKGIRDLQIEKANKVIEKVQNIKRLVSDSQIQYRGKLIEDLQSVEDDLGEIGDLRIRKATDYANALYENLGNPDNYGGLDMWMLRSTYKVSMFRTPESLGEGHVLYVDPEGMINNYRVTSCLGIVPALSVVK